MVEKFGALIQMEPGTSKSKRKFPKKVGENVILSLDAELQKVAEISITEMVEKVANLRRLPDQGLEKNDFKKNESGTRRLK